MDKKEFMESAFYGLAAYTFYGFTAAIISFIKYRSRSNPVYATVKRIQLAKAIVSMFTTQVALITRFSGTDMNSSGFDAGVMNTLKYLDRCGGDACCEYHCSGDAGRRIA